MLLYCKCTFNSSTRSCTKSCKCSVMLCLLIENLQYDNTNCCICWYLMLHCYVSLSLLGINAYLSTSKGHLHKILNCSKEYKNPALYRSNTRQKVHLNTCSNAPFWHQTSWRSSLRLDAPGPKLLSCRWGGSQIEFGIYAVTHCMLWCCVSPG